VASSAMDAAMSTMYMNDIMKGELATEIDVFQTVSPSLTLHVMLFAFSPPPPSLFKSAFFFLLSLLAGINSFCCKL
jgi:hypothetical protein